MYRVFVILVGALMSLSTVSSAAEQYAYRAGEAYFKTAANSHTECEAQCRGDAACRGWNFIRPNPRSQSGICEFNARKVMPISSPISISGEMNTSIDPYMSRAVVLAAGNTVRVGTPILPTLATIKNPARAPKMVSIPATQPKRIIKNMPVENVIRAPIPAGYKPISSVPMQPFTGPIKPRSMTRQQIYNEQMMLAQKRADTQAKIQMQQAQYNAVTAPVSPQQFIPKMRQTSMQPSGQMPVIQARTPMNQPSLYGSLHDDLTRNMTPVPRPLSAPDMVNNPNAPLATSRAAPAVPVQAFPIGYPALPYQGNMRQGIIVQEVPGLAGG